MRRDHIHSIRKGLAIGLVGALVLAACGGDDDADDGATGTEDSSDVAEPADPGDSDDTAEDSGDADDTGDEGTADAGDTGEDAAPTPSDRTLRVVAPAEPPSLNPINLAQSTGVVWGAMFESGLIALDPDFRPTQDGLITNWERPQLDTWRLTLRDGVTFHNGEPFDAEAVKFTIETYQASEGSPMRPYLLAVTSVDVVDPLTVDLVTESPDLSIPAVLTAVRALPPVYYAEVGADDFGLDPVGVGPYVFDEWSPGTAVRLTANQDYWRGTPGAAGIEFTFAGDPATRTSLLETGEVDVVYQVPIQLRDDLRANEATDVIEAPSLTQPSLFQITNKTELADPELRNAVAMAMDRAAITDFVLEGQGGIPSSSILAPLLFDPVEQVVPDPDFDAAKAIVDAAGNPTITLNWAPTQFAAGQQVGEAVAGMLEEVGFTVNRNPADPGDLTRELVTGNLDGLVLYPIVPVFPHPKVYVTGFLTSQSITNACTTPGVDEANAEAIAAEDEAASDEIYIQIEEDGIFTDRCVTPLYYEVQSWGLGSDVTGFTPPSAKIPDYFPVGFDS